MLKIRKFIMILKKKKDLIDHLWKMLKKQHFLKTSKEIETIFNLGRVSKKKVLYRKSLTNTRKSSSIRNHHF